MPEAIQIKDGVIAEILKEIFATMVPIPIEPAGGGSSPLPVPYSGVTAIISLSSEERRFIVILQSSEEVACAIFAAMIGATPGPWSPEVADSFGEIANMTAGNFKTTLGVAGLSLSIPSVIRGAAYEWNAPGMKVTHEERFLCGGGGIVVRVGEEGR